MKSFVWRCLALGWLCVVLVPLCGCGGSGLQPVTGDVTFDGKPVEKGEIILRDTDAAGQVAAGPITDGKFAFEATPGPKKVEITATREEGIARDGLPNYKMYIPKAYNEQSKLTAEIKSGGENTLKFDLTKDGK